MNFSDVIKCPLTRDRFFKRAAVNFRVIMPSLKGDFDRKRMLDEYSINSFLNRRFATKECAEKVFKELLNKFEGSTLGFNMKVDFICECFYREFEKKIKVGYRLSMNSKACLGFLVSKRMDDDYILLLCNITYYRLDSFFEQYESDVNFYLRMGLMNCSSQFLFKGFNYAKNSYSYAYLKFSGGFAQSILSSLGLQQSVLSNERRTKYNLLNIKTNGCFLPQTRLGLAVFQQTTRGYPKVRQSKQGMQLQRVLSQASVANFGVAKLTLDDSEWVFDLGPDFGQAARTL